MAGLVSSYWAGDGGASGTFLVPPGTVVLHNHPYLLESRLKPWEWDQVTGTSHMGDPRLI